MYNQKMAVAIKTNGKVLREFGEEVKLPFNSEFSILIKNLNTIKALVNVSIDGTLVTGDGLVVNANNEVDLERYLNNNNTKSGNKFKFIERNDAVETNRGIKVEDGIIRVEFKYALQTYNPLYPFTNGITLIGGYSGPLGISNSTAYGVNVVSNSINTVYRSVSDAGITVPGSVSDQKFQSVSAFATETQSHVIVLKLSGYSGEMPVTAPVTVATKPTCVTCGTVNKATSKFCTECGTGLIIV